jgi:uncharacterized protein YbaR (Trm112 family)
MDILACPLCKGELGLEVEKEGDGEILAGRLTCLNCQRSYPIRDGIPDLRPPEVGAESDE